MMMGTRRGDVRKRKRRRRRRMMTSWRERGLKREKDQGEEE